MGGRIYYRPRWNQLSETICDFQRLVADFFLFFILLFMYVPSTPFPVLVGDSTFPTPYKRSRVAFFPMNETILSSNHYATIRSYLLPTHHHQSPQSPHHAYRQNCHRLEAHPRLWRRLGLWQTLQITYGTQSLCPGYRHFVRRVFRPLCFMGCV